MLCVYENDGTCFFKANLALSMFKHEFSILFELHTFDLEKKKNDTIYVSCILSLKYRFCKNLVTNITLPFDHH